MSQLPSTSRPQITLVVIFSFRDFPTRPTHPPPPTPPWLPVSLSPCPMELTDPPSSIHASSRHPGRLLGIVLLHPPVLSSLVTGLGEGRMTGRMTSFLAGGCDFQMDSSFLTARLVFRDHCIKNINIIACLSASIPHRWLCPHSS